MAEETTEQRLANLEERDKQHQHTGFMTLGIVKEIHQKVESLEQKLNGQIILTTQLQTEMRSQGMLVLGLQKDLGGQSVQIATLQADMTEIKQEVSGLNGKMDQVLALLQKRGE